MHSQLSLGAACWGPEIGCGASLGWLRGWTVISAAPQLADTQARTMSWPANRPPGQRA